MRIATGLVTVALATGAVVLPASAYAKELVCTEGSADTLRKTLFDAPRPMQAPRPGGVRGVPQLELVITDNDPDADLPLDVVYLPDGQRVAVVHAQTDNVTFFDVNTRQVVATVGVGDYPTHLAATPDGRYVVVPNVFSNTVTVIDAATYQVAATIPVSGVQPFRVEVTPDSGYAVVGVINDAVVSALSVIDLNTLTEARTIATSPQGVIGGFFSPENGISGSLYTQFRLSSDGRSVVLPHRATTLVNIYDIIDGAQVASVDTGANLPTAVDISGDGLTAVVSHEGNAQRVSVIDLETRSLSASVVTGVNLGDQVVRITPDGAYAMAAIPNNLVFIDLANGGVAAQIMTGVVGDIEISYDGQYAFVSNFNARVIDIASRTLVATLPFAASYPAAASPTELRAVALNNRFRENIHFYRINGASGAVEGWSQTGPAPEGDATRDLALSPDGRTLIANNNTSANTCIIDVATGTVRAWIPTGDRPLAAAVSPDSRWAVICNSDEGSGTLSIIDLQTDTVVRTLNVPTRPSAVRISPDGTRAYVLTIAGTDLVYFINLDGANSSVISSAPAGGASGGAGSWQGVAYSVISGVGLAPDGSIFAVCDSFDDTLNLFDTSTRARVATVPVGDFPISVAFSPDSTRAYVANAFENSVSVVDVAGSASSRITNVTTLARPFTVNVDAAGRYVYIGTVLSNPNYIQVLDTQTNSIVANVSIGNSAARGAHLSADGQTLYVATTGTNMDRLVRVSAAGPASAFIDDVPLSGTPSSLVFSERFQTAMLAQPGRYPDGLDFVRFPVACPADFDQDGSVNTADITAFLSAWFNDRATGSLLSDFDANGVVNTADITAFLSAWFEARAGGC